MKSRLAQIIIIAILAITLTACGKTPEKKVEKTDAQKFKEEYEKINGIKKEGSKNVTRELSIPEDNPFIYATAEEIVEKINDGETFIVYFGFAECPWCRSILPTLIDVSKDLELEKIYYVNVKEIRDTMELTKDGEVKTSKEGTDGYYDLLDKLDSVLENYTLTNEEDEEIETGEKRIYAPNVVSIVSGKAKELETGIGENLTDPYMELTNEITKETYNKFKCSIKCVLENKNTCSSKKSC